MPYVPIGPARDQSLQRARQQILKMLEQEERAKRRWGDLTRENMPDSSRFPPDESAYGGVDAIASLPLAGGDEGIDDNPDDSGWGIHPAQSAPMLGPAPLPLPLPPIATPGSKENQEWVKWIGKLLRNLGRSLPGSGPGCDQEWIDARKTCSDELAKPNPSRQITGGYSDPQDCARGLVSERCGGNRVDRTPRKPWRLR